MFFWQRTVPAGKIILCRDSVVFRSYPSFPVLYEYARHAVCNLHSFIFHVPGNGAVRKAAGQRVFLWYGKGVLCMSVMHACGADPVIIRKGKNRRNPLCSRLFFDSSQCLLYSIMSSSIQTMNEWRVVLCL